MNTTKAEEAQDTLQMYVNDMLAVEQDTAKAIASQSEDANVLKMPAANLVRELASAAQARVQALDSLSNEMGGGVGKAMKEAVASVAGALAGLYGKVRTHPVSRMLRDDYVALSLAVEGYSMLHTTALALGHTRVAALAERHMREITPQVMRLAKAIPPVVVAELAKDFPELDPSAANRGAVACQEAWRQ
ncbi:hypothetical protein [Brevifollis gellanilyticus]|uniref:Uncharacterized protein n=1 Tax=Brevifollis gellanilyticus TaxID=748831 RepID=A0A512MI96_9BACT|nr:hypothetical protein [Brevifollis gellanilyticus]GEP46464.1 hypothetical protein BGE01nite_57550 [Brevifollis gellanilyticus]